MVGKTQEERDPSVERRLDRIFSTIPPFGSGKLLAVLCIEMTGLLYWLSPSRRLKPSTTGVSFSFLKLALRLSIHRGFKATRRRSCSCSIEGGGEGDLKSMAGFRTVTL